MSLLINLVNFKINLDIMKEHTSHDVVLLCPHCHQRSNISDYELRSRLANQCNAPLTFRPNHDRCSEITRLKYDMVSIFYVQKIILLYIF